MAKKALAVPEEPTTDIDDDERREILLATFSVLVNEADSGDATACAQLMGILNQMPELWSITTSLQARTEEARLYAIEPEDRGRHFTRALIRHEADELRRSLAGPDPTPLERLLCDRVVCCWLQVMYAEREVAWRSKPGTSWRESQYAERQLERSNRMLLRAVKALAMVRRLELPALQVNIGEKQLNQVNVGATRQIGDDQLSLTAS